VRKRVVIPCVTILALMILPFVPAPRPRAGTIKYHQKEYLRVTERLNEATLLDRIRRTWSRLTGSQLKPMTVEVREELKKSANEHHNELVRLGFLDRREIIVTDLAGVVPVLTQINARTNTANPYAKGILKTLPGTNRGYTVIVIGRPGDLPEWEGRIRRADALEK